MKFDFILHWLFVIVWALLAISGFSMVGAKFGWIIDFNYGAADYIHRLSALAFVILTCISIFYELLRKIKNDSRSMLWNFIGPKGFGLFTLITTLLLIVSGILIWFCMETEINGVGFAIMVHEYISYIMVLGIIWHIYKKIHILMPSKHKKNLDSGRE